MAEAKLTKQEVKDLHERLVDERNELQMQLLTIEEETFAATQSDSSGDVGLDDESADAGTARARTARTLLADRHK